MTTTRVYVVSRNGATGRYGVYNPETDHFEADDLLEADAEKLRDELNLLWHHALTCHATNTYPPRRYWVQRLKHGEKIDFWVKADPESQGWVTVGEAVCSMNQLSKEHPDWAFQVVDGWNNIYGELAADCDL
jgi:hypothetical protein